MLRWSLVDLGLIVIGGRQYPGFFERRLPPEQPWNHNSGSIGPPLTRSLRSEASSPKSRGLKNVTESKQSEFTELPTQTSHSTYLWNFSYRLRMDME